MTDYKQCFWAVTGFTSTNGDISADSRTKLADVATTVQTNNSSVLFAVSCGGRFTQESPEISLCIPSDNNPTTFKTTLDNFTTTIQKALDDKFGKDKKITAGLDSSVRFMILSATKIAHFKAAKAAVSVNLTAAFQANAAIAALPSFHIPPSEPLHPSFSSISRAKATTTSSAKISAKEISEHFSLSAWRYEALKTATGDDIEKHIKGLQGAFDNLSKETKTSAAAAIMVTAGLITIGKSMYGAYTTLGSVAAAAATETSLVAGIITALGGVGVAIGAAVAVAVVAIGLAWVLHKDARNLLLVVNAKNKVVTFTEDTIRNGERRSVTKELSAVLDPVKDKSNRILYPAGFYSYQKFEVLGLTLSFYGSTAGLAFECDSAKFSVGLDCPNTIIGGNNAIGVYLNETSAKAAEKVDGSGTSDQTIDLDTDKKKGKCEGKRSNKWGSLNCAVCIITPAPATTTTTTT